MLHVFRGLLRMIRLTTSNPAQPASWVAYSSRSKRSRRPTLECKKLSARETSYAADRPRPYLRAKGGGETWGWCWGGGRKAGSAPHRAYHHLTPVLAQTEMGQECRGLGHPRPAHPRPACWEPLVAPLTPPPPLSHHPNSLSCDPALTMRRAECRSRPAACSCGGRPRLGWW